MTGKEDTGALFIDHAPDAARKELFSFAFSLAALALFVGVAAWGGIEITKDTGRVASIWLANGAVVAYLLFHPLRRWAAIVATAFAANAAGDLATGDTLVTALALSSFNSVEILLAAAPLRARLGQAPDLGWPGHLLAFSVFALALAPFASALLASGYLWLAAGVAPLTVLPHWFLADALGLAITVPLFLAALRGDFALALWREDRVETAAWMAVSVITIAVVFVQTRYPLLFLIPPVLIIGVARKGLAAVILCMPFLAFTALAATVLGHGPFGLIAEGHLPEQMILVQLFILANLLVSWFVANGVRERQDALTALEQERRLLAAANAKLASVAKTDALTGIPNRRSFDQALAREWRRAQRDGRPIALLLVDVDHFKAFNDHYGHPGGDRCLAKVGRHLESFTNRAGDVAARFGGEEFALLLPGCSEEDAKRIAERCCRSVEALGFAHRGNPEGGEVVTVSIGVAALAPAAGDGDKAWEALIKQADDMLYEAKRTGRNKAVSKGSVAADAAVPANPDETERLAAVAAYTDAAQHCVDELNHIAYLAATMLKSPISVVSLVGRDKQVFMGRFGLDAEETPRSVSFCAHTLNGVTPLVVDDATQDPRFMANGLVTGELGIRFYAGAPLITTGDDTHLGALCVIDTSPRGEFDDEQRRLLGVLARLAVTCMEAKLERQEAAA